MIVRSKFTSLEVGASEASTWKRLCCADTTIPSVCFFLVSFGGMARRQNSERSVFGSHEEVRNRNRNVHRTRES
jgi:hypothetical protein